MIERLFLAPSYAPFFCDSFLKEVTIYNGRNMVEDELGTAGCYPWALNFVTGTAIFLAQDLLGRKHGFLARSLVLLDADLRFYAVAFRPIPPTKFWALLSLLAD
jgi:hypothetical protein